MGHRSRVHGITCWISLIGYTLVAGGIPLPAGVAGGPQRAGKGKDCSIPFPCMQSPCGCSTAAQCYASCCCHTPAQRRAWAKARGLGPIVEQLLRLRGEAATPQTLAGSDEPTCDTESDGAGSCCSAAHSGDSSATPVEADQHPDANESDDDSAHTTTVTLRAMLACGGIVADWLTVGAGPPPLPVAEVVCLSPANESMTTIDESCISVRPAPDAPPPRAV